jgi:hypothetical protein
VQAGSDTDGLRAIFRRRKNTFVEDRERELEIEREGGNQREGEREGGREGERESRRE